MTDLPELKEEEKALLHDQFVYQYLLEHPAFFQHHPELLNRLRLPHAQRGAVSLVERQLEMQRERIRGMEEDITRLMSIARQNEHIFLALNALHIAVHQAKSLTDIQQALQGFADAMPQVKYCRLLGLEQPGADLSPYQLLLSRRLQQQPVYLGRLNKEEQHDIFPAKVHSVALLRIDQQDTPLAILAFGSELDDHFQPEMDVLFLRHLVTLLALVLPAYVNA